MTDEEALEYWEKIRKTFMEHYESEDSYWGCHHWMTSVQAVDAAISALRDRIARQNPQPLTLAELRKMDGEPVWCTDINGRFGSWAIVGAYRVESPTEKCRYEYYGQSWLAYRRNPEGSENDG